MNQSVGQGEEGRGRHVAKHMEPAAVPHRRGELDLHMKIASWIGGAGLALLALSPLLKWVNFGAGGFTGIIGDGKIVLGLTVAAAAAYAASLLSQRRLIAALLGVQAWGTVAVFWMGGLIWKVAWLLDSPEMKDNPFAALLGSQVSPGAGLYVGLIGGALIAGAVGYMLVRQLRQTKKVRYYYVSQGLSCALGMLLVVFVGFDRPPATGNGRNVLPGSEREAPAALDRRLGRPSPPAPQGGAQPPEEAPDLPVARAVREKEEYLPNVELYDVTARYYTTFLDERVPGVDFKVRNNGSRTLSEVEVTVYFKDARGNTVAEEDYHPVLTSSFSLESSRPLKPGYIWQQERGKFYKAERVPSEWREGNIEAAITDIGFAELGVAGEATGLESPEKQAYLEHLALYDFQAKYYTTVMDERVPGVEFKLKNSGEGTLDLVEVTVYFKDRNGRVISEEDYCPVLVSEMSFEPSKPLKPGYIWQMERGKFYQAPHVPSEWQEGDAEAEITDLQFAEP